MFERFTKRARIAVVRAQAEADKLGRPEVGTEHLLLGLLADPVSLAGRALAHLGVSRTEVQRAAQAVDDRQARQASDAAALAALGIDLAEVTRRVEGSFGPGALDREGRPERRRWRHGLRLDAASLAVLQTALREAQALHHDHLGTEHLLLALTAPGSGPGGDALGAVATPEVVRAAVLDLLRRAG